VVESRGCLQCVGLLCVPCCSRLSVPGVSQYSTMHRCVQIPMTESFLDSPNIVADLEQMRGKRVPQGMTARSLDDLCFPYRRFHSALQYQSTHMMPPLDTCARVERTAGGGKYVLPCPFLVGIRAFSLQGIRQVDTPESLRQVMVMQLFDIL
jgi:hypothetical protein